MAEMECIEHWKPVPGYEGFYEISSIGRVKSVARTVSWNRTKKNIPARIFRPKISSNGYRHVILSREGKGRVFTTARLIALTFLGMPESMLTDHKNRRRHEDDIENIRPATSAQNASNKSMQRNNTSGAVGVSYRPTKNRWRAQIQVDKKQIHLGHFCSKEEAIAAYRQAAKNLYGEYCAL